MAIPNRPQFPTRHPNLLVQWTDDGSRTLARISDQETYHSCSGALIETRHVYLRNSGIEDRLRQGLACAVLEVGLGTGMSMLATLDLALSTGAPLDYLALEHDWLSSDLLRELQPERWVEDQSLAARFLAWRDELPEPATPGSYRWQVDPHHRVTVHVTDAVAWRAETTRRYDAIYFDPFAPAKHPQLWTVDVFRQMAAALRPEGKLTTYCVSRQVREAMREAGLVVYRIAGPPGGKRNVLIAEHATQPLPPYGGHSCPA